jgi:hypothetical protein
MENAQTPDEAAAYLVRLALGPVDAQTAYGELVQHGRVVPWI